MQGKTTPTPTPTNGDTGTDALTTLLDTITNTLTWLATHLPITLTITAIAATWYGWGELRKYYRERGRAIPPLGFTLRRITRYLLLDDTAPLITRPTPLATRTTWLQWRHAYLALTAATITLTLTAHPWAPYIGAATITAATWRTRRTFRIRHQILMQMYAVAAAECRFPKDDILNPWTRINVTRWRNLHNPDKVVITYPAGFKSEEIAAREAFERNFGASVSDQHSFIYTWKSANNQVIAEPTPFLPAQAPYPGHDNHPWNLFPLGIKAGGEEALWDCQTLPHVLIAGATGSGKMTSLSTLVPVPVSKRFPQGWATVGDLRVGDVLFDPDGQQTRVTKLFPIDEHPDLYRVTFSDGTAVDADAEHLWFTETRAARASEWMVARRVREGRGPVYEPLLSPEVTARLRAAAAAAAPDAEVTVPEVAVLAGVSPTSGWLYEVAGSVGHVAENQVEVAFSYGEQVVEQEQMVTLFPARAAWEALAGHRPRVPDWYARRGLCGERADAAVPGERVSVREIAAVLGLTPKRVGVLLRNRGLVGVQDLDGGPGIRRTVSFYPAREAWSSFAETSCVAEASWLHRQGVCAELARECAPGATVSAREIGDVLGLPRGEALATMKRLGVSGFLSRETVRLEVAEKTVTRPSRLVKTYSAKALLSAVADYGDRLPHDQRHKKILGQVRTTREIAETLRTSSGHLNHSIPVTAPLDLPEADLRLHPYVLGVWLGDGSSRIGQFYGNDHEIAQLVASLGYDIAERLDGRPERHPDYRIWSSRRLTADLRRLGLLQKTTAEGSRKRIPAVYLRASVAQRRALLAGLLDTDGTVSPQGTVQFTNTNRVLAFGVLELARSLGFRASVVEGRARLQGRDYGPKWTVSWTCAESPFWLPRKSAAHRERSGGFSVQRNSRRFVVSVERVASVPARCIAVDSPRRLFLCGEGMVPTHNSVAQRTILLHALQKAEDWRVVLIDPKRVELGPYKDFPNVLKVATLLEDQVALLESCEQEMLRRYDEMEKCHVTHFRDLPDRQPALLIMVDETFALLSPEKIKDDAGKERDALHARAASLIGSIARLGRAAGVFAVLATQRPDASVLPGETKLNLDVRIACGRMDTTPSQMVLDSDHATRLPLIKGRSVLRLSGDVFEYQGYFLPMEQVQGVVDAALQRAHAGEAAVPSAGPGGDVAAAGPGAVGAVSWWSRWWRRLRRRSGSVAAGNPMSAGHGFGEGSGWEDVSVDAVPDAVPVGTFDPRPELMQRPGADVPGDVVPGVDGEAVGGSGVVVPRGPIRLATGDEFPGPGARRVLPTAPPLPDPAVVPGDTGSGDVASGERGSGDEVSGERGPGERRASAASPARSGPFALVDDVEWPAWDHE